MSLRWPYQNCVDADRPSTRSFIVRRRIETLFDDLGRIWNEPNRSSGLYNRGLQRRGQSHKEGFRCRISGGGRRSRSFS